MRLIFCADPLDPRVPDPAYAAEIAAANVLGLSYSLLSASDTVAVERVVRRFLELQGEDLNEGLVFREYIEFEPLSTHSRSAMPLTKEFRIFFLDREPILTSHYWEEGEYGREQPDMTLFLRVAQDINSRFFTMDIAKRLDQDYMIVELGDGQVAGLPERADPLAFYAALKASLPR